MLFRASSAFCFEGGVWTVLLAGMPASSAVRAYSTRSFLICRNLSEKNVVWVACFDKSCGDRLL